MKSLTEHLWFEAPQRRAYINITPTVEELVRKSAVQEGLSLVNAMHITTSASSMAPRAACCKTMMGQLLLQSEENIPLRR
jgi:thiamine phosphate synthase YjbQ (UPF0047 family)